MSCTSLFYTFLCIRLNVFGTSRRTICTSIQFPAMCTRPGLLSSSWPRIQAVVLELHSDPNILPRIVAARTFGRLGSGSWTVRKSILILIDWWCPRRCDGYRVSWCFLLSLWTFPTNSFPIPQDRTIHTPPASRTSLLRVIVPCPHHSLHVYSVAGKYSYTQPPVEAALCFCHVAAHICVSRTR